MTNIGYDLAVTFGRFNLLHAGHLDMFERMVDLAPSCLIGVSDGPANLPVDARVAVIRKALGLDIAAAEHFGVPWETACAGNPFAFFEFVTAGRVLVVLGEDQEGLAKAAKRVFGWDYRLVKRLGSSTEVRSLIDSEQWDRLAETVPAKILPDVCRLRALELKKQNGD